MPVASVGPASASRRSSRRRRDERGAVAIMVAAALTMLLIVTAMVLDFGLVRLDRQAVKSRADSAAMAGIVSADGGTGDVYTHRAVCAALEYMRSGDSRFTSLPDGLCAPATLTAAWDVKCEASSITHAVYDQTVTASGVTYRVVIKSPYQVTDGGFVEESYSTLQTDQSAALVPGCDQVGVLVTQSRKPGLGSLATTGNLQFTLRSTARAIIDGTSSLAPALILLERTACSVLTVGSAGGGSGTYIKVFGNSNPDTPGSIHVDSNASGGDCGSGPNQQLIQGKQGHGIVAYATVPAAGTPIPGVISSRATFAGVSASVVSDSLAHVYGTDVASGTSGTKIPVAGRDLVGRTPVDVRYRAPVRNAIAAATAAGVWAMDPANPVDSAGNTWTRVGCNPAAAVLEAPATTRLYVDCPNNNGITLSGFTLATHVFFNGFVKNGNFSMPNATRVYVSNTASGGGTVNASAITMGNNNGFCVRADCAPAPGCSAAASAPPAAQVFIRQGNVDLSGGLLRMCQTTAILLGGSTSTGCVPSTDGLAPTATPCSGVGPVPAGNTVIDATGGAVLDWTAPNEYAGAVPTGSESAAYGNLEDLALWSESAGQYRFAGSGAMNTVGIFMAPNAHPFYLGGGSNQTLVNSQYVARTFAVGGGGILNMTTDPRNAVTIPAIKGFVLIR